MGSKGLIFVITGAEGQVGTALANYLTELGIEFVALTRRDLDITSQQQVSEVLRRVQPAAVINCAAYNQVGRAESEPELAYAINRDGPQYLASVCADIGSILAHYSTDYVFNGEEKAAYEEDVSASPVNAYGKTKLAGEKAIQSSGCDYLIFRTAWVYASRKHNFFLTILKLAMEKETLKIVDDQIGAPTSARLIAETTLICLLKSVREKISGVFTSDLYHLTSSGYKSWYGFAEKIINVARLQLNIDLKVKEVIAIPTSEYQTPAKRPLNSRLAVHKLEHKFNITMPDWEKSMKLCINEIQKS